MTEAEKIKLRMIYQKDGTIKVCDQDGREFDWNQDMVRSGQHVQISLPTIYNPFDLLKGEVSISGIPIEYDD